MKPKRTTNGLGFAYVWKYLKYSGLMHCILNIQWAHALCVVKKVYCVTRGAQSKLYPIYFLRNILTVKVRICGSFAIVLYIYKKVAFIKIYILLSIFF